MDYVLGLARNKRLERSIAKSMTKAKRKSKQTGKAARYFVELDYRMRSSWSRERRVVAKAEHLPKGRNPRFIVTSPPRSQIGPKRLYETVYCARGDMENRIKEQQLFCFADRTSAQTIRANQVRLYFRRSRTPCSKRCDGSECAAPRWPGRSATRSARTC